MNPYTNPLQEIRQFFSKRSVLATLILTNCGVWLFAKALGVIFFLFNQPGDSTAGNWMVGLFALPASLEMMAVKPWTLFTYMFLHLDFFHILFNMLWLYWFGRIFLEYLSSRQLLVTYILGGLAGGVMYVAAFNIFPVFLPQLGSSLALGASASVMAIVMAISVYVPNYTINLLLFGRVKILYLALILFIFDFFAIPGSNSGGHIAHIGGALWGLLYILVPGRGRFTGMNGKFTNLFGNFGKSFRAATKKKETFTGYTRPKTDNEYNKEKLEKEKKTDAILDKISKGGYDSLTKEEKAFLFKSSGKNN